MQLYKALIRSTNKNFGLRSEKLNDHVRFLTDKNVQGCLKGVIVNPRVSVNSKGILTVPSFDSPSKYTKYRLTDNLLKYALPNIQKSGAISDGNLKKIVLCFLEKPFTENPNDPHPIVSKEGKVYWPQMESFDFNIGKGFFAEKPSQDQVYIELCTLTPEELQRIEKHIKEHKYYHPDLLEKWFSEDQLSLDFYSKDRKTRRIYNKTGLVSYLSNDSTKEISGLKCDANKYVRYKGTVLFQAASDQIKLWLSSGKIAVDVNAVDQDDITAHFSRNKNEDNVCGETKSTSFVFVNNNLIIKKHS